MKKLQGIEYHYIDRPELRLGINYLPSRKSPCLYEVRGSTIQVLAYFRSEKDARRAQVWIEKIEKGRPHDAE